MGRRVLRIVLLLISASAVVATFAVAPTAIHNRLMFGTFDVAGAPPRVDYCGRRYYPARHEVAAVPAGLTEIDTAPSGMPVLAHLLTPQEQAQHHTDVCTMVLWVQTGSDEYVGYSLSGGP